MDQYTEFRGLLTADCQSALTTHKRQRPHTTKARPFTTLLAKRHELRVDESVSVACEESSEFLVEDEIGSFEERLMKLRKQELKSNRTVKVGKRGSMHFCAYENQFDI